MPSHHSPRSLLLLLLVGAFYATRLVVDAHLFSWLLGGETLCEPDYVECPNGGLAFRDRKYNCEFTPCGFIPDPPTPPPPPSPKMLPVHQWFGRHDFIVPTLDATALLRGRAVEREWTQMLGAKQHDPRRTNFSATIDLYIVAKTPSSGKVSSTYAANAHEIHLDSLVASQQELFDEELPESSSSSSSTSSSSSASSSSSSPPALPAYSETARMLAVSNSPWTRWELFGQLGASSTSPTSTSVQIALRLLKNVSTLHDSNGSGFATLVLEALTDSDVMTELLYQSELAFQVNRGANGAQVESLLVFLTDFRVTNRVKELHSDDDELLPWNITRTNCSQPLVSSVGTQLKQLTTSNSSTSIPITLPDPSIQLLLRDDTTATETAGQDREKVEPKCSCWTRSLVGNSSDTGVVLDHETKWMLCQ